jgi:ribosomal protein S18 acetylase RimI-like enzyme
MTLIDRIARKAPAGVALRLETDGDRVFVDALYASTRTEEMAQVPWPPDAVAAFLQSQASLQRAHYTKYYPDALRLIVEREEQPVGRVYIHESPQEVRLMDIALLPDHRGQGIGSAILGALVDHARERSTRITLHVEPANAAQRMYRRLGFRLVESRGVYDFLEWVPPRPLDRVTPEEFEGATATPFRVCTDGPDVIALVVESVTRRMAASPGGRAGFSVVFASDSRAVHPQRIYRVEHDGLGTMDLFLVPIGQGPTGIRYEAVFG